jgi:hypothetical protein
LLPEDIAKHIENLLEPFGYKENTLGYWEREVARNGIDWIFKARGGDHTNWEPWREPCPWRPPLRTHRDLTDSFSWYDSGLAHALEMIQGKKGRILTIEEEKRWMELSHEISVQKSRAAER